MYKSRLCNVWHSKMMFNFDERILDNWPSKLDDCWWIEENYWFFLHQTNHRYENWKIHDDVSQWWLNFQNTRDICFELQTTRQLLTLSVFLCFFQLSQILGHSDQLYIRLPPGLRIWQVAMAIIMTVMALWVNMQLYRCTSQ